MLTKFIDKIAPNVAPVPGIEDDERVSFGVVAGTNVAAQVHAANWTDSIIERSRFQSTTIANSSFERVAILDCDLSGVTFSNCLLRDCLIMGVNAKFHFALDNCILDRVTIARSRVDSFDIHNSRIGEINFIELESAHLDFRQCQAHKRKGQVSFEDCELKKVGGLEEMAKQEVSIHVDAPMWRDLGDYYLRERGIQKLDGDAQRKASLLDKISQRQG